MAEEIRKAIDRSGKEYIFTIALPPTDWELYDYDVIGLAEHVDWFNLMTFDYHTPKNIPKTVGAHSDLKLIDSVVFELLRVAKPTKFVLGMAAYGRTYTLADERCKELGCPFRSPGLGGCGNTPGFLPFSEIDEYIQDGLFDELHQDVSSSSMVAVVGGDQMISFDDVTTWTIKEAYAEMMCLRGTMLWSIDMLAPRTTALPANDRLLSAAGRHAIPDSVSAGTDRSLSVESCDVCGSGTRLLMEQKQVLYDGNVISCASLQDSLNSFTRLSFKCSLVQSLLSNLCCAEPCHICPQPGMASSDRLIEVENTMVSCADHQAMLEKSGVFSGSTECKSSVSSFSGACCSDTAVEEAQPQAPTPKSPCSLCARNDVHAELRTDSTVTYKGAEVSCLDLNHVLAKSESRGSDVCVEMQSSLFGGCCYEKCNLCNSDQSLSFDTTVSYKGQILSCDELASLFSLSMVQDGSLQCDAMRSTYSSVCCFSPPRKHCDLCNVGSASRSLSVNTSSFVKMRSSSVRCVDLFNGLAEKEEDDSEICLESKLAFSQECCSAVHSSGQNTDAKLGNQQRMPPSSSAAAWAGLWLAVSLLLGMMII